MNDIAKRALIRTQIIQALIEAEEDPDNNYPGFAHSITEIAKEAEVEEESVREFVEELISGGIAQRGPLHSQDQFTFKEKDFKTWRRRLGI